MLNKKFDGCEISLNRPLNDDDLDQLCEIINKWILGNVNRSAYTCIGIIMSKPGVHYSSVSVPFKWTTVQQSCVQ